MKIVIVYSPKSQKHLVDSIITHCSYDSLYIDGFCSGDWTFNYNKNQLPYFYKLLRPLLKHRRLGFCVKRLFLDHLLGRVVNAYDLFDLTYFNDDYYHFLDLQIEKGRKYKITFWGSDFYRASDQDKKKKKKYLDNALSIQVETPVFRNDLINMYHGLDNKINICNYGIDLFDTIDSLRNSKLNFLPKDSEGRIIVTCGYNGSRGQQHIKMLEILSKYSDDIKSRLFLVFPMTYGLPDNRYLFEVINLLDKINIPHVIYTKRLSDYDLAKLRLQTNIVLNIQISDSLSTSLLEHLYAGNILLAGDWLPYSTLNDNNIDFFAVSMEMLSDKLKVIIKDYNMISEKISSNITNIKAFSSWTSIAPKLHKLYLQ